MPEFNLAQALGLLSFVLGILCFYQKNDQHLRIMMVIFNINHAIHFALLGASTACLGALISAFRTGLSIKIRSAIAAYIFIFIAIVSGTYLAQAWYDLFPIIGTCIGTYAVYRLSGIRMRIAFVAGAACWLTNNIIVGSIGGIMLESTLLVVNCLTIWRIHSAK